MKDCPCCTLNMNNIHQQISLNSRIMIHNNYMRLRMKFLRYNSNCVIIFVGFLVNFCFVVTFFYNITKIFKIEIFKVTIFLIARVSSTTRHSANSVKENPPANKRTKLSSNALSVLMFLYFRDVEPDF